MYLTKSELAECCGVSVWCLRIYLDRAEFNQCRTNKKDLWNMTDEEIDHLKELIHNRNGCRRNTYKTIKEV